MIRCNLAILLAERNLKITKVSSHTKISRTTLTALANNYSQGIQFDTLDTLCLYLKVTPDQLIAYEPVDIEVLSAILKNKPTPEKDNDLEVKFRIVDNGVKKEYVTSGSVWYVEELNCIKSISIDLHPLEDYEDCTPLIKAFRILSTPFRNDLTDSIVHSILEDINLTCEYDISDAIQCSFTWPPEFY